MASFGTKAGEEGGVIMKPTVRRLTLASDKAEIGTRE